MNRAFALSLAAVLAICAGCKETGSAGAPAPIVPEHPLKVVDVAYMDTTTKACVDFFQYAVGNWINHEIGRAHV